MATDPDKPSTWVKFKTGMCDDCWAGCCTMPVEVNVPDLIRIGLTTEEEAADSVKKLAKRLEREGFIKSYRATTGVFILTQKANNDCYYLDTKTRLCTIYDLRPTVCRKFPLTIGTRPGYCPARKKKIS